LPSIGLLPSTTQLSAMPLNYSKWDQLELSDDSDIEGHPNVDKKSLIRWKQRDIHEKRELRKHTIVKLHAQIDCNNVLLPRITAISSTLSDASQSTPPTIYFNSLVEQLEKNPSRDCPPTNDPTKLEQTYDGMLLSLLKQVGEDARVKVKESGALEAEKEQKIGKLLASGMAEHVQRLKETIDKDAKQLAEEEKEQRKHITSDDLHEGFASKYVPPPPEPAPVPISKVDKGKKKTTTKATEFEVLNPKAASSSGPAPAEPESDDEDEESLPELTPSLEAFSKIPLRAYEKSFEFIQSHRDVYVPGASDALLVAAFRAQSAGKAKYAKQCVHQSLLLQYCEKLGKDGLRVFFRKMISADQRAESVFVNDMANTYQHLVERVNASLEDSTGKEQIQLVPENPSQTITFNVPDGPPPENLVYEGADAETVDIEEVRKALQFRWDVFDGFPEDLKEALKKGELDGVNKVLGDLEVPEAEAVVQQLDMAGILSFADGGIRDETGKDAGGSGAAETH
ncbi:Hsp90 co-chaperone Cdc37, partial [Hypsizygus marmoreus]